VRALHTLTSFETFDSLAGAENKPEDVFGLAEALAHEAIRHAATTTAREAGLTEL
jgi:hypothetical protein